MNNLQQLTFPVYGMNCASCASKLTTAFNAINGIEANVNITLEKATLSVDSKIISDKIASQIDTILQQKGYQTDYQKITFEADWSCASCVEATLKGIRKHPLVLDAKANLATQTLYVVTLASFVNKEMINELKLEQARAKEEKKERELQNENDKKNEMMYT